MVGRKTTKYYVDTETTYEYDGEPISLSDLETMSDGNMFDINKVTCGRLLFGMADDLDDTVYFMDEKEFQEWLGTLGGKNDIFIHNLKFDMKFIGRLLYNIGFETGKKLGKSGALISVKFNKKGTVITFKDSMKLTNKSLADSGVMLGCTVEKGVFEIDSPDDLDKPETKLYLTKDVLLLKEIVTKFLALVNKIERDAGVSISRKLPITIGAISKKIFLEGGFPIKSDTGVYRNRSFGFQQIFGTSTIEMDSKYRKFFFGGHGVALMPTFDKHFNTVNYFDRSSMYPYVMISNEFPTIKGMKTATGFLKASAAYPFAFYEVVLKQGTLKKGTIPSIVAGKEYMGDISLLTGHFLDDEPKTLYIIDHYGGRSDWKNFLKDYNNLDYEVVETTLFKAHRMPQTFIDLVIYFYNKKEHYKATNRPLSNVYKLALNAFYGKIGQGFYYPKSTFTYDEDSEMFRYNESVSEYEENGAGQLSVIVAACITMFARNLLLDMCDIAGHKNTILTATDAIAFVDTPETRAALAKLNAIKPVESCRIGALDGEVLHNFALQGTKSYQYYKAGKLVTKVAGMPEKTKALLPFKWWLGEPVKIKKSVGIVGGVYLKNMYFTATNTPHKIINPVYERMYL